LIAGWRNGAAFKNPVSAAQQTARKSVSGWLVGNSKVIQKRASRNLDLDQQSMELNVLPPLFETRAISGNTEFLKYTKN